MFDRVLYKENAKQVYKGNYWSCILASGIVLLINMLFNGNNEGSKITFNFAESGFDGVTTAVADVPVLNVLSQVGLALSAAVLAIVAVIISIAISVFVLNMLRIGLAKYYIEAREGNYDINNLLFAYRNGYLSNSMITMVIKSFTIFLWSLLLVIPGIIKAYELRFVPYILADDPSVTWQEAFEMSKAMTDGHKMDLFVLDLSFIGWKIFDSLTFGIGQFLTAPYYEATEAEAYSALGFRRSPTGTEYFEV